jgi:hypothetical protein
MYLSCVRCVSQRFRAAGIDLAALTAGAVLQALHGPSPGLPQPPNSSSRLSSPHGPFSRAHTGLTYSGMKSVRLMACWQQCGRGRQGWLRRS